MIRVLHFISSLSINSGLMSVIMNYYRAVNRNNLQFGFLYFKNVVDAAYEDEIHKLGGETCYFELDKFHLKSSFIDAFGRISQNYDILHVHELYLLFAIEKTAKANGIKCIVGHAHTIKYSENVFSGLRNRLACIGINHRCNYEMACTKEAGKVFFGKNIETNRFIVLNNAICLEKYQYNVDVRDQIRKQLNIDKDSIVIGHVGRFTHPKNHPFIIDIFRRLCEISDSYILLLIGEGKEEESIRQMVNRYSLADKVLFLGSKRNVNEFYSAMDIFLFPSLYEGLGFALIEAQANGLKCFVSNAVPKHAKILDTFQILELDKGAGFWAKCIAMADIDRMRDSLTAVSQAGYNINLEGKKLEETYRQMIAGAGAVLGHREKTK